jgi:DNA-binding transcriptional ArsR family regulator
MKTIHVIPVGTKSDVILESIKMSGKPIQKAYLVLSKKKDETHKSAEEIKKALEKFIEVENVYVDTEDVYSTLLEILKIIKAEKQEGEVYINISDVTKELCIACLLSAQISRSKIYMAVTSNGKVERVVDLLIPPVKSIGEDKMIIIKTIDENGGEVESINKLIELIEGKTEDQKKYMAQRARMSYHLKGLEDDGLVEMQREGKNVRIKLTPLGRAYALMEIS